MLIGKVRGAAINVSEVDRMTRTDTLKQTWLLAQREELVFWQAQQYDINMAYHRLYDDFFAFPTLRNCKVLEVGCGAVSAAVSCLHRSNNIVLGDPLLCAYMTCSNRNVDAFKKVCLVGDALPFRNTYFHWVLLLNMLDHANNPKQILAEACRVGKHVAIYTDLRQQHECDVCHPYELLYNDILQMLPSNVRIVKELLAHIQYRKVQQTWSCILTCR